MKIQDLTREALVQDIWDCQADLQIKTSDLKTLTLMPMSQLRELRDSLWSSAYPHVGLDAQSRMNFIQETSFDLEE